MKILLFNNWFPPITSGSSFYTSSLARALAQQGHEIAVVTLDWGPEYAPAADLPFRVHRLPVFKFPKLSIFYDLKLMGSAFSPPNFLRLRKIVRAFRPDVIHHVNHIFDTTFLTLSVARACGVPIVGSITTLVQNQNPRKQFLMEKLDQATVGYWGVRRWDAIISLDYTVYDYLGKLYGKKTQAKSFFVPFGVNSASMPMYEEINVAKSERPQILMVGHIHPFRNPVNLIRAMPAVLKRLPNARLILAGRISLTEPAHVARQLGLSSDHVQFLEETPHEQVIRLIKESHVFTGWATGPFRGLGTAPMEAMLCRTPVVNDSPEDLFGKGALQPGKNIMLVDSKNPDSIADGLIRLLTDKTLREQMGEAGRQFVLQHLSWDAIAKSMTNVYTQVLAATKPKGENRT